jgi:CHAT domain-containing protein
LGRAQEARALAASGLAVSQDLQLPWLAYGCHHILARAAESEEKLKEALDQYEQAIGAIERVQSGLLTEFRSNFLADKIHVYGDAIDCCLRQGRVDLALDFLERAKSRALVDYLAQNLDVRVKAKTDASRELADELARLREEHNWFYNRLYDLGTARDAGAALTDTEAALLRGAIADREKRTGMVLDRLLIQDDAHDTVAHAIRRPGRPKLDERTVLLEYYLREDSGEVFVLSTAGLRVESLELGTRAIQRILLRWQLNVDAGTEAVAAGLPVEGLERNAHGILESLYQALLGPVERYLASYERIVVIPYGPLHGIPFHALHDGHTYTAENWEISVCPSSGLLNLCTSRRQRDGDSMLIVACSDGGRLPQVLREAQILGGLFRGECLIDEQATCGAVAESAARHAVIHLAAHAEARLDNPTFAHLKLSDGQLSTVDILNMELDGALVVLSACETGRGVVAAGDEVIGLSRGVLHAGAATLIHSLWRVGDGSTAKLMEEFYRGLRAGDSCSASLRNAMLVLRRSGETNLYAWAAFQLVGDGGTRLQRAPPAPAAVVPQVTFDRGDHTRR